MPRLLQAQHRTCTGTQAMWDTTQHRPLLLTIFYLAKLEAKKPLELAGQIISLW